jgi:hypothetical protein
VKIVFLDIDGVLVNGRSMFVRKGNFPTGDPPCVKALNAITEATGAAIVITSTWRLESSLAELRAMLKEWGVTGDILDVTPTMLERERADEIRAWLQKHREASAFVVIDDQAIGYGFEAHLVRTDEKGGLCGVDAERAIEILKREV